MSFELENGFKKDQEKISKKIESFIAKERESETCLYFEFDNEKMRDEAMELLKSQRNEKHEFDENFLYFKGIDIDPERPKNGIKISFFKNPPGLRQFFEKILIENGIIPTEEYQTVNGEPIPLET